MGRPQYSSSEQQAVNEINTAVATLNTTVQTLKDTDVANLSSNVQGLGWWSKYEMHQSGLLTYTPAALGGANVWGTVRNITGVGVLTKAMARCASAGNVKVRITIDGTIILEGVSNGNAYPCGLLDEGKIHGLLGGYSYTGFLGQESAINSNAIVKVGYINTSAQDLIALVKNGIFFNTSCKIELQTASANVYYEDEYGVIV